MWILIFLFLQPDGTIAATKGTVETSVGDCQFEAGQNIAAITARNPSDKVFSMCIEVIPPAVSTKPNGAT